MWQINKLDLIHYSWILYPLQFDEAANHKLYKFNKIVSEKLAVNIKV